MGDGDEAPTPPSTLRSEAIDVLDRLGEEELRAVIDYAQARRRYVHSEVSELSDLAQREDVVRVDEQPEYTLVVKTEPFTGGDDERSRGKVLYRVTEEPHPDGRSNLHWTYLGRIGD